MSTQSDWRWCSRCQAMFFSKNPSHCPGGGAHDPTGSNPYILYYGLKLSNAQASWQWCNKCQSLFFSDGSQKGGLCAQGGAHDGTGSNAYVNLFDIAEPAEYQGVFQHHWRYCSKCQTLFFGDGNGGICPGGGTHQDGSGRDYVMLWYSPAQQDAFQRAAAIEENAAAILQPAPRKTQPGWRWCQKCQGMFFAGNATSRCPSGGAHDPTRSYSYLSLYDATGDDVQSGWRWCQKCQGMFFAGNATSCCPSGGTHDATGNFDYALLTKVTDTSSHQDHWRWCSKCQGIFFGDGNGGSCPAGGPHVDGSGSNYVMTLAPKPATIEAQCKLIIDYDSNHQRQNRYQVVLIARDESGAPIPSAQIKLLANENLTIEREEKGVLTKYPLGPTTPLTLSPSATGRCRFTIEPSDNLTVPLLKAQSDAMPPDQWSVFSPDIDVHTQLASITTAQFLSTPAGKGRPLLATPFSGQQITLSSWQNLPLASSAAGAIYVNRDNVAHPECGWTVVDADGSGAVFLKSAAGLYLGSHPDGSLSVAPSAGEAERWFIDPFGTGWQTIFLRSAVTGMHLSSNGLGVLYVHSDALDWQKWTLGIMAYSYSIDACHGSYDFTHSFKLLDAGSGVVSFQAVAKSDVHIAISPLPGSTDPMYEIVIGGWNNTRSVIRRSAQGTPVASADGAPILCQLIDVYRNLWQPTALWVSLDAKTGLIAVGSGAFVPGTSQPFLSFIDPAFIANAQYVTFSSWDTPIQYTGISLRSLTAGACPATQADASALAMAITQLMTPCLSHDLAVNSGAVSFGLEDGAADTRSSLRPAWPGRKTQSGTVPPVFQIDPRQSIQRRLVAPAPQPAAAASAGGPQAFGLFDDLASVGNLIDHHVIQPAVDGSKSIAATVVDSATHVSDEVKGAVPGVIDAISKGSRGAFGTAAQYLDTSGAAAKLLIQHAEAATPQSVLDFAGNTIATAHQLAIDASRGLVLVALVVKDGVTNFVSTVVEDVESAALITAAFFKRVGLEIKMVIDFLAWFFNWDDLVKIQVTIKKAWNDRMAGLETTINGELDKLPDRLKTLETAITTLGAGSSGSSNAASAASFDLSALGGSFGYLVDKMNAYLGADLGLPADLGLGSFSLTIPDSVSQDVASFFSSFKSSSFLSSLQDPRKLLASGAQTLIPLITPFASFLLKILNAVAKGALEIASGVLTAIQKVVQYRLYVPFLTEFIEFIVFRGQQRLTIQTLITLAAAALLEVITKLSESSGGALSFAEPATFDDSQPSPDYVGWGLLAAATLLNLMQTITSFIGAEAEANEAKVLKKATDVLNAICGGAAAGLTVPYGATDPDNYLTPEQWATWGLNLIALVLQIVDLATKGDSDNVTTFALFSAVAGLGIWFVAIGFDQNAIEKPYGDPKRAGLDLGSQLAAGLNNISAAIPSVGGPAVAGASNLVATGLGAATLGYLVTHPGSKLG